MNQEFILKEAQSLAKNYSFWMVSGDISHLYGIAYEDKGTKYEVEIKFLIDYPKSAPLLTLHENLKLLLGDVELKTIRNWNESSKILEVINELKNIIVNILEPSIISEPIVNEFEKHESESDYLQGNKTVEEDTGEYITPDLDAFPPDSVEIIDLDYELDHLFYNSKETTLQRTTDEYITPTFSGGNLQADNQLMLLQQQFSYDEVGPSPYNVNIYLTITLSKTFVINLNFKDYPKAPILNLPKSLKKFIGDPFQSLSSLKKWNEKNPPSIVEIIHDLERKLLNLKELEQELGKINNEFRYEAIPDEFYKVLVHILTYGFKSYTIEIDLSPHPNKPNINLPIETQNSIGKSVNQLKSYKDWEPGVSESVEIVREISWLIDRNSRINFEIDLLKEHYNQIEYIAETSSIKIEMKGKMKTEDLKFQFEIILPIEYPMKMPTINILNKFEIDSHEKTKNQLQDSFKSFYDEWTPFKYLIDLFNLLSEKIFEVSVISCVICHRVECPTCNKMIAAPSKEQACYTYCPHCERPYHQHCWKQTLQSFGKCGFCLR